MYLGHYHPWETGDERQQFGSAYTLDSIRGLRKIGDKLENIRGFRQIADQFQKINLTG